MGYKKIIEYYFEGNNVDIDEILNQPDESIKNFIKTEIKPNWKNCKQTLKLHNELSKNKFTKPLTHKQYMTEIFREKRTQEEIKEEHRKKIKNENPVIKPKCIDII